MSATFGTRSGKWQRGILWALAVIVGCVSPLSNGVLMGTVVLGAPVAGAQVRVWRLDLQGQKRDRDPVIETVTDESGRFRVELGPTFGNLLVEAIGGQTKEIWSSEVVGLDATDRLWAVLPLYEPVPERAIVISPFTALAAALIAPRAATDEMAGEDMLMDGSMLYHEDVRDMASRLGKHLGDIEVTDTPVWPIGDAVPQITPGVRHGLVLAAFSLLSKRMAEAAHGSVHSVNSIRLTQALVADAMSAEGRLDGVGPEGPIVLGSCPPPTCPACRPVCRLSTNTLRKDLAETLAFYLIGSEYDGTGLVFGDGATVATPLAQGVDPVLFGDVQPGDIRDQEGPRISLLPSPVYDESSDVILGFADNRQPIHRHSEAAVVDLSSVFGSECEQTIHKHVNLLNSPADNPLRWRFAVRDEAFGFAPEDIRVTLEAASIGKPQRLDVVAVEPAGDTAKSGTVFEAVALREPIIALTQVEGRFDIDISAVDRLGNASDVLSGCWQHVPRAGPLQAGPAEGALGPGSLAGANLNNDNITLLLAGTQPFLLARIPVANHTGDAIYLAAEIGEVLGTYSRTWVSARALLRKDEIADTCVSQDPPTCSLELPRDPRIEDSVYGEQLPTVLDSSFLAVRVVDGLSGKVVEGCGQCRLGEVRLEPGHAYEVQIVVTTLGFLLPEGVEASSVAKIWVGPSDDKKQLTGLIDESNHVHCREELNGTCFKHGFYTLYQALTDVEIDIHAIRVIGRTAPGPMLLQRIPRPAESDNEPATFSSISTSPYVVSTTEPGLPLEGGD